MKKIVVEFKSVGDIRKLKTIMRNVCTSRSDHLPDINRFNLNKLFTPTSVEKAEIHIITSSGTDVVTIGKSSLTFFTGDCPFTKINPTCEEEAKYIVLPWNLNNQVGVDNLKNLVNRIGTGTTGLKYIIFVKAEDTLNQSVTSLAGLNLSNIVAEDNTEMYLSKIEGLEQRIISLNSNLTMLTNDNNNQKTQLTQKQQEINNLNAQASNLNTRLNVLDTEQSRLQSQLATANNNYNHYLGQYNTYYAKYNQALQASRGLELNITNTSTKNVEFGTIGNNLIEIQGVKITPASGSFTINNLIL